MDESVVSKALEEARSFLSSEAAWIGDSSLHLRAFYLGLYVGLGQLGSESDRKRILVEMLMETMSTKAGNDLFGASSLGANLRSFREQLLRSLDSSCAKQSPIDVGGVESFRSLALSIEQLDQRWRFHCDLAQRELGSIQSETVSPEQALKVLEGLDSSFRELFRVLTERPRGLGGS